MPIKIPFLLFFSVLFLSACNSDLNGNSPRGNLSSQESPVPHDTSFFQQNSLASCEVFDEAHCPSGVALLLGGDLRLTKNPARCSSFLISPRILITNNHCIPDEVKQNPESCQQLLTAIFPKTPSFAEERAFCERLLAISEEGLSSSADERDLPAKRPDYAVILLDREIHRQHFPLSRAGVPDKTQLTVFAFDPLPQKPGQAVLKKKHCTSLQNTDLVPSYKDTFSPVVSTIGCEIISGNSGSVALDSQGHVRALLHATWPLHEENEVSEEEVVSPTAKVKATSPTPLLLPFSVMTNAACIPLPENFSPVQDQCGALRALSINYETLFASAGDLDFTKPFEEFQKSNQSPFRFLKTKRFLNERVVTIPTIDCINANSLRQITNPKETDKMIYLNLPLWGPTKRITSGYRYKAIPARIASVFTTVQFNPQELLTKKTTPARELRSSFFTYSDNEVLLKLCPP